MQTTNEQIKFKHGIGNSYLYKETHPEHRKNLARAASEVRNNLYVKQLIHELTLLRADYAYHEKEYEANTQKIDELTERIEKLINIADDVYDIALDSFNEIFRNKFLDKMYFAAYDRKADVDWGKL